MVKLRSFIYGDIELPPPSDIVIRPIPKDEEEDNKRI